MVSLELDDTVHWFDDIRILATAPGIFARFNVDMPEDIFETPVALRHPLVEDTQNNTKY